MSVHTQYALRCNGACGLALAGFRLSGMAIAFARARYVSRTSGGNAVRSAAYNGRAEIEAQGANRVFTFQHRGDLEHHEIMLPERADPALGESAALWNAAETAERRKDAQVARELVLALPADAEVTLEDWIELTRSFAAKHFVSKGVAVQLDIHAPHADPGEEQASGEGANPHAHLLVTTRRVEGSGFASRKARDLDPVVRRFGGRNQVAEGEAWGELWQAHQDRWFLEHGLGVRVDATAAVAGAHIGPVRMRAPGSAASERAAALRAANEDAARDPLQVLAALTRNNATFTRGELDRYLVKHLDGEAARADAAAAVLGHPELLALHERESGAAAGRYTTRTVRAQEGAALADAAAVLRAGHHGAVPAAAREAALAGRGLRPDQGGAFEHGVGAGGLKVVEGRAGTGKSYALGAVRDAYERAGQRVVGLAPTNAVAQDLGRDGFRESGTVHAALFALKTGRASWDRRTVLLVDEAAMLDSPVMGELLAAARASGAKVVLAGDDRQLASIERGGLFTELRGRHGSAVIRQVERQRVPWQREAAQDLSEGRFARAVQAFDRHGAVTWSADDGASLQALVRRWQADSLADPQATRFVFAYTNQEADALNAGLREVLRGRGALGPDVRLDTRHGPANFAVGDRVQFTATAKRLGLFNGNAGVITGLDAATGVVTVRLDGGRQVSWQASAFDGVRHGYAGTIYKGQGRTLDHTYLLHGRHWRAASSYVALTRQRHGARVFVSRAVARDAGQLARQMARGEVRAASVAWATAAELAVSPRRQAEAAAARAAAVREAAVQGVQAVVEQAWRHHAAGLEPASLRRAAGERRTVQALFGALSDLGPRLAVLERTLAGLPGQVAAAVQQRVAQVEAATRLRRAAEAVAAGAKAAREAAVRGVQAWTALEDRNTWDLFSPSSLRRAVVQRRTAREVDTALPALAPWLAGLGRTLAALPEQVAGVVRRQRAAERAELQEMRARLFAAAHEGWWQEQNPYQAPRDRGVMPPAVWLRLRQQVDALPGREVRARDQALGREQEAERGRWVAGVRARVLEERRTAWWVGKRWPEIKDGMPPAVAAQLEAEVHALPHERLVAFEAKQVKALLLEEGSAAWGQVRPWPGSMAAHNAALAAERERLRAEIDLIPMAELVAIGEARRRQAEDVQRQREAESAIARAKPSPGYSPGM